MLTDAKSEVFMVVKIHIEVLWVVTLCSAVVGYQNFGGLCHLHLQGPPRHWYLTTTLHGNTTQNTSA
jgi:hypothetical protein